MGSPGKVIRQLSSEQIKAVEMSALYYVDNARRYRSGLSRMT
jgi:carbonic anhydrase/acetyltransferase-like protein (isoleucine patch superfamily)